MSLTNPKTSVKTLVETSPSYLTDSLVEFKIHGDVTASVRSYLEDCRKVLYQKMDEGFAPHRTVRLQSLMMDQLITGLFLHGFEESQAIGVLSQPLALFALGGYGRAELNLFSDIDLLFIYEGKAPSQLEVVIKKMLYPLWDSKMEIGYATRTVKDCERVMKQDSRAMSSMLDARFLAGDRELAEKFFHFLESKFSSTKALHSFVEAKTQEMKERLKRFGGSVYVQEPNLKESEGGLRDWHTLRYYLRIALKTADIEEWVHRGLLTQEEADQLMRALDFLWNVRNRLHRRSQGNQDQLTFEFQEPLASEMGFQTGGGMLGVEKFMQAYYGHAARLKRMLEEVTRRLIKPSRSALSRLRSHFKTTLNSHFYGLDGKLYPKSYKTLDHHPLEITRAFYLAQKNHLKLDEEFKSWISRHLHLIDDSYRHHPVVCDMLREMFADLAGIGQTLWEMQESHFLGAIIPEFGEILFQTQHDVYHVYTVDTHSLLAVGELSKLKQWVYDEEFPLFKKCLEEVSLPGCLALGILFHDIGKGKGGNHSEKGAALAQLITQRMGYGEAERKEVEFLVLSHLLMPQLSQRRDLGDQNLIAQFARSMGSIDRLNMLFILTWADLRAVGPEVWTPWKGTLLQELCLKTHKVLETGDFSPERARDRMKQIKQQILETLPPAFNPKAVKEFLDSMPPRYFLTNALESILEHFSFVQEGLQDGILFKHLPDPAENLTQLSIFALNSPRLFEQVTGVMAANQVNILALEQFFDLKGEVLLLLKVTDQRGQILDEERRTKALEGDLREVLQGKISMEKYSLRHPAQQFFRKKIAQAKPPRVEITNDVSAYYTVIDIYANDRIGLLHDIAQVMRRLNLFIEVSKISTKVDQVADVFYVKDIFGHKITDPKKLEAIKQALLGVLSEPSKGEEAGVGS